MYRQICEAIGITPQEGKGQPPMRWNWDSALLLSPHNSKRLYFAANILFRSDDRGDTWKAVSGDLTRQLDRDQLPVFGKIQSPDAVAKHVSTSFYGNIVALTESPRKEGLLYVGTDDGLINITEDGGQNWRPVAYGGAWLLRTGEMLRPSELKFEPVERGVRLRAATPEALIRLEVDPAPAPSPALRYLLLPELKEMKPGNPIFNYFKCSMEQESFLFDKEAFERRERLLAMPLKELPAQDLQEYGRSVLIQADRLFNGPVPETLVQHLRAHADCFQPELTHAWNVNGYTWRGVRR